MKKTIVLGVCGGIAAFKAAQLTSDLIKAGYDVEVIMTENATQFVAPLTFEALISHNVVVDTFEKVQNRSIHHISLAKKADLFILVPASANVIAKVAHGIADADYPGSASPDHSCLPSLRTKARHDTENRLEN